MELTTEAKAALVAWFTGSGTGLSSQAIAITALAGVAPSRPDYPYDMGDFGRCARLLQMAPEVRAAAFPLLAGQCAVWARLTAKWDDLMALHMAGDRDAAYEAINAVIHPKPTRP